MTEPEPQTRPPDVDTGFWLWLAAVPLLVIGYVVDRATVGEALARGARVYSQCVNRATGSLSSYLKRELLSCAGNSPVDLTAQPSTKLNCLISSA